MTTILLYKNQFSFDDRLQEATKVMQKYPDRIPIICERSVLAGKNCPLIDKRKYLVSKEITIGEFLFVIRRKLRLPPEKALFLFINGYIPATTILIKDAYHMYKDNDGYLYINYGEENTFG